jgi:hypothetical protein
MFKPLNNYIFGILNYFKKQLFFLSVFFLLMPYQIMSTELLSIYECEFPIQDSTNTLDQTPLIRQGIKEVLIRASGSEKVLQSHVAQEALTAPDQYVKKLSYHQRSTEERSIKILFHENLINQLLNKIKQPIWQHQRPLVSVWLMIERGEIPSFVGHDSEPELISEMSKVLTKRAIPFTFPLLDLTDVTEVIEADVWRGSLGSLQKGAARYNPDVILLGRLMKNSENKWQSHWTLLRGDDNIVWIHAGQNLGSLLNETAETLSLKLVGSNINIVSAKKDINASERMTVQHLLVAITGILNMEQYAKTLEYLQQQPSVIEVEVSQITPEKTVFNLQISTDKETLRQSISEGNLLIENPSFLEENAKGLLAYKIVRVP